MLSRQYDTKVFHNTVVQLKLNLVIVIRENYEIEHSLFQELFIFKCKFKTELWMFQKGRENMNSTALEKCMMSKRVTCVFSDDVKISL